MTEKGISMWPRRERQVFLSVHLGLGQTQAPLQKGLTQTLQWAGGPLICLGRRRHSERAASSWSSSCERSPPHPSNGLGRAAFPLNF